MRLRLFAAVGAVLATSILTVALAASPTGAAPFTYTSVSTGYHRTCAVTTEGLGLCWGWNRSGSLGTADRSSTVLTPSLVVLPSGERFRDIAAGSYFTSCGLAASGNVYCWGESGVPGRLLLPAGTVVTQLSVGASQVCALTAERQLWCHGDWNSGELGVGDAEYTHLPVRVQLPDAAIPAFVSAGIGFTCVVATTGTAYCSGVNAAGQLGNGGTGTAKVFTRVAMPTGVAFSSISAGLERACAVDTTGGGWCWGQNYNGALGDDTYTHSRTPRAVVVAPGTTLTDIQTGWYHTCAITATGTTLCWGSNDQGALGWGQTYGGKTIRTAALPDGVQARQLEIGLAATCITSADARIFCWGSNLRGSIGNGTAAPVFTPAEVLRVGTPDAERPMLDSVTTHSAVVSGTFVPNGATTGATVFVATNPSFDDARMIVVPLRRQQQSTLTQLFTPVNFSMTLAALRPATEYHVKVRANNTFGSGDSPTSSFVTLGSAPSVVTTRATDIGGDTATISTTVDAGLLGTSIHVTVATDAAFTRDVRTVALGTASGAGETALTGTLTSLTARTSYFVRVEASNEVGTATGEIISFSTIGDAPTISDLRAVGGRKAGTVTLALGAGLLRTNVIVAYRPSGSAGAWQSIQRDVDASTTDVTFSLTGLQPATTYDVKATATNEVGSGSAEGVSFTTTGGAPTLTAPEARDIGDTNVTLRTSVDSNEFATRVTLQIDTNDSFSNYDEWFAGSAVAGSVSQISLDVSELVDSSVYYARFVAVNAEGSTISEVVPFTTSTPVGKLLKRRTDPVDPEPVVEPTPPAASMPPIADEPVLVLASPTNPRGSRARSTVKASASKAAPARKSKKKQTTKKLTRQPVKASVKKRSVAR